MRQRRLRTPLSESLHTTSKGSNARGIATVIALMALSVGVYAAVSNSPAVAAAPGLTAPERVYTGINQDLAFTNTVDPISGDNRLITADIGLGPGPCQNDPSMSMYDLDDCARVQLDLSPGGAGLMFIPGLTVVHNAQLNIDVVVSPDDAVIDQYTGPLPSDGALVYHLAGTKTQINNTLKTMLFQPTQDFEDTADVNTPPSMHILAIDGDPMYVGSPAERYVEIKVEGDNDAPTLTVPATATDAPVDTEQQYPSMLSGNSNDPTNRLADAVDPEMCNLTLCGAPFQNPGHIESDDKMLLVAWLDPSCGQFHLRGGAFSTMGNAMNHNVPLLLTNDPSGLGLEPDQAAAIQTNLSLQAQTVDLTLQSSNVTDLTNAWAGVGDIDEVRYALSQITYKSPSDLGTCDLNLAVSDLGNSGMPALNGYVGSPIGGADMPQPGYEVPDAKSDEKVIQFNVKDTHPHVTVEQATQGPGSDPTNGPAVFTATFSEAVDGLTAGNLTVTGASGGNIDVQPSGPSDTYTITVTPGSDGTVTVSIPADEVHANAGPMDSTTTNKASTSTDNSITVDTTGPSATITLAPGQPDPTSVAPINFRVQFDEAVDPFTFDSSDISFAGSSAGGALTGFVTPVNATTFDVAVFGMSTSGSVTASVSGGGVDDLAGNGNTASGTATVTWTNSIADPTTPTVTIDQAAGQADPTSTEPVQFTATFSEPVVGFTSGDVDLTGMGSTGATASVSGGPAVYTVSVTGMTVNGPITASIPAAAATDGTNPSAASTSSDNTVTWANGVAGVTDHFTVTAAASTVAGTVKTVTVTAKDFTNATVTSYAGTVHITSSDGAAQLPANATLTNGVGTFNVILKTAGAQTATATDTVMASITGTTSNITVNPAATSKYTVAIPASPSIGTPTNVTVTAKDTYNNLTPAYGGTVKFTSTDGAAVVPGNTTLTNGVGTFPVTFNTLGAQTVTATDFNIAAITGTSNSVTVLAAPATHFTVSAPVSATAGTSFMVTVQARDAGNAATTNYSGTVHFTSSDGQAVLPANATLVNGSGTFSVTLKTAGNDTITATDTVTASITGNTSVAVSAAAASHLSVAAPGSATNGSAITVTVTALDQFGNTDTSYAGTVHFTSTDGAATLPGDMTLVNGVGAPQATLNTNGNQTVTATDTVTASITGTSGTISVSNAPPPPATHFSVTGAASSTAGAAFTVTVTALDAGNAATTGYSGTVHFTSSDAAATLPADATLVNGVGMFSVTLFTAGVQTVTATDTVTASITGTTAGTTVSAAAADHLTVSTQAAATIAVPISVVVTAKDVYDNTATGYAGTVQLTSTDGAATLPAANTLTNGVRSFQVTLNTLGSQTVTATDTVTNSITGTSGSITVSNLPPLPATHFSVSAPASAIAGTSFSVTVTALDVGNGTANSYSGTVHFTSTSAGTLPADISLVNGVGVVSATLTASGNQTITATDTVSSSITGTSNTIAVAAALVSKLQISTLVPLQVTTFNPTLRTAAAGGQPYSFSVTALDQFNNTATGYSGVVHFTSDDPTAELPVDSTLTNGVGTFTVIFHTVGTHSVSAVDSGNSAIAGAHSAGVVVAADPVTPTTSTVPTLPPLPTTPATPTTASRPAATPLPATGTDTTSIVLLAVLTLFGGALLVVLRTRRHHQGPAR